MNECMHDHPCPCEGEVIDGACELQRYITLDAELGRLVRRMKQDWTLGCYRDTLKWSVLLLETEDPQQELIEGDTPEEALRAALGEE